MKDCVFCKIAVGEMPSYKIYEDNSFLGFLDIAPRTLGHSLLIPKKHYQWVYDVPNFDAYWRTALKITRAIHKALNPYFVTYVTHGLEIPHAHIHIMPRQKNDTAFVPSPISVDKNKMTEIAALIHNTL